MHDELNSLNKNRTWIMIKKPKELKVLGSIQLFKRNGGIKGVEKPKVKLVAQVFA